MEICSCIFKVSLYQSGFNQKHINDRRHILRDFGNSLVVQCLGLYLHEELLYAIVGLARQV